MKKKLQGQTLLEVTIALSAILLVLAAIVVVVTMSVNNSTFIKNQGQAGKYAQQGVEYIRYLRNNDLAAYSALAGTYCFDGGDVLRGITDPTNPCNPDVVNIGSSYKRTVVFDTGAECSTGKRVTVVVKWSSGKCKGAEKFCHKSEIISCFSDPTIVNPEGNL